MHFGFSFDQGLLAQKIWFQARAGRKAEARVLMDSLTRMVRPVYMQLPLVIAYAGIGDVSRAANHVAAAAQAREIVLAAYPPDDPIFDPLRQTREYRAARERMGLVPGRGGGEGVRGRTSTDSSSHQAQRRQGRQLRRVFSITQSFKRALH